VEASGTDFHLLSDSVSLRRCVLAGGQMEYLFVAGLPVVIGGAGLSQRCSGKWPLDAPANMLRQLE